MIRLYTAGNSLEAGNILGALQARGISCHLRRLHLAGALGELPPLECQPEIWLDEESQLEEARQFLAEFEAAGAPSGGSWRCPKCGEDVPAAFSECWACSPADSPDPSDTRGPLSPGERLRLTTIAALLAMVAISVLVLLEYGGSK